MQASYTPTAMDYDFALITLKDSGASAGYMGMDYGNGGIVTLNLTTAGYPVRLGPCLFIACNYCLRVVFED